MSAADAPSNPLSGASFDALYNEQIEPQLRLLEADRQKAMRISLLIWAGFAVLLVIEGLALPDRKSTRLNSSHPQQSRMPSSA